jgi:tyrosine-protein phosphatase non-receptor type 9
MSVATEKAAPTEALASNGTNSNINIDNNGHIDFDYIMDDDPGHSSGTSSPIHSKEVLLRGTELTEEEEEAVGLFMTHVNSWRRARSYTPLSREASVKFLMARKFAVDRALALYRQHELMRLREKLSEIDANVGPLKEELLAQKFTVLSTRDHHGAALALFNAHLHEPSNSAHKTTLQNVVYQLDVAMEDPLTQRAGLVFIYNMAGSKYANFDYDLSQKILTLLKGCYPARLKKVLIVTAPLWFKAPFKVLRLFVREKLRDRVFTVSMPQLVTQVPAEALTPGLGGVTEHDHDAWLIKCAEVTASVLERERVQALSASHPTTPLREYPTLEQLESLPVTANGAVPTPTPPPPPPPAPPENDDDHIETSNGVNAEEVLAAPHNNGAMSDGGMSSEDEIEATASSNEGGMSLPEFVEHVRVKGRKGLYDEYAEIKSRAPPGTFNHARSFENQAKNRYTDVLCYDHSRVLLNPENSESNSDYINANFVDGYKQSRAFIFSQGPLPRTFPDFWQLVWEHQVMVIVMTTKTVERHRTKCGQYWPEDVGETLVIGENSYTVTSTEVEHNEVFIVTYMTLTNEASKETRPICHFQFVSWPDYGVPDSAMSMLTFLQRVREKQAELTSALVEAGSWSGHELGPPMVVHCSAGIGRTGTFATLDMAIRKFEAVGKVDIRSTVEQIRSQRAFSIQMPDQYVFCHLAFLEYVLNMEYVEEIDLTGFDDDCDSD